MCQSLRILLGFRWTLRSHGRQSVDRPRARVRGYDDNPTSPIRIRGFPLMTARLTLSILLSFTFLSAVHASDDLPRDPNNVYGTFDNGMKYIIRHNSNPPGKVALNLHVRPGSNNESEQ